MIKILNYWWRRLGTGFLFIAFLLGGVLATATIFPCIAFTAATEEHRIGRTRRLIQTLFRAFAWLLHGLGIFTVVFKDDEKLKNARGTLIVANHPTLIDVVMIISKTPNAQCIVKHELWDHRYMGGVVRAAGYIRNDGDPENLLDACIDSLRRGENLIIFPEGTRTAPAALPVFQRGFANVAVRAGCDIQTVQVACEPPTLTKGEKWHQIPAIKPRLSICVTDRIQTKLRFRDDEAPLAARKLTREVQSLYNRRLKNARIGIESEDYDYRGFESRGSSATRY
jgi:1-acyl-sn-glycerol-3-phosphate acyltransferase